MVSAESLLLNEMKNCPQREKTRSGSTEVGGTVYRAKCSSSKVQGRGSLLCLGEDLLSWSKGQS